MSPDNGQMGFVFSAFTLTYAFVRDPDRRLGRPHRARRVLTRIVIWWSSFTIATAAAFNFGSLLAIRVLFGAGEAGAFPNVSKTFLALVPVAERGTAQGFFFAGAHLGGGLTPILAGAPLHFVSWRVLFMAFGSVGFFWAAAWFLWFRDDPAEHPQVSRENSRSSRREGSRKCRTLNLAAFGQVVSDRNMIALSLMYFTQAYGFYFNITWLPTYLRQGAGLFIDSTLGVLAGLPLILERCGRFAGRTEHGPGGSCVWPQDRQVRYWDSFASGRRHRGHRRAGVESPLMAAILFAIAGAAQSFLLAAAWSTCLDIAGPNAGLVTGVMNTAGQMGAFFSPIVMAYLLHDQTLADDWAFPLRIAGGLSVLAHFAGFSSTRPGRFSSMSPSQARVPDLDLD